MSDYGDQDCGEYDSGDCGYEHDDFEDEDDDDTSNDDESYDEDTDKVSIEDGKASDNIENEYATDQDRQTNWVPYVDDHGDEGDWMEDGALEEIIEKASEGFKSKNKKWCRLFEGERFTNARQAGHSYLPTCTISDDGTKVLVPSMCVKDMKDIDEYTQAVTTSEGTTYIHKVQLTARKFHTHPVDLSHLFSGWRMTKVGNRFFLDSATGVDASSAALTAAVNHDDDSEIVMPRALLEEQLIPFVRRVNEKRGYACCEIGRVGFDWFSARNLLVLGHEHGHAPFQTSEKAKTILPMAVGGNRYINEFAMGRTIGTKNGKRMFEQYEASVITKSLQAKDYVPKNWPAGTFPDIPEEPRLKVPCLVQTHTVLPNGGVHHSEENVNLLVTKPLHRLTFERHHRKSGCIGLDIAEHGPLVVDGFSTALSALGAGLLDAKPSEYFRIEPHLQTFLKENLKQQETEMGDILTLCFVKTSQSHSAGNKGRFPIFKAMPILRICDRWYNSYTLDTFILNDDYTVPENLRYFDVSVEQPKASPNVICRIKTYLTDGSCSEMIEYSDGTIAITTRHSQEGRNDANANIYVPNPSLLGNIVSTASCYWSRSEDGLRTQESDILAARALEQEPPLGLTSSACSKQPTQDPVGLIVHTPEVGAKFSEHDDYRPPRVLQEERGGIEEDDIVPPSLAPDVVSFERHDGSNNDTGRPPKKSTISCNKRGQAAHSIPPVPHETERGQKFDSRSTTYLADHSCLEMEPKYVHAGKKSIMQGLLASPNRVSDPIGIELLHNMPSASGLAQQRHRLMDCVSR